MKKLKLFLNLRNISKIPSRSCFNRNITPHICVIGGGPAGFYSAQRLTKLMPNAVIDIYERLPVPFGLVRYGVAPDHGDVKNVINTFTKTAKSPQVNFYGNISLGKSVTLLDFRDAYHAVLLAYGAEEDRKLGVPGENLTNVISAARFVGWYNGLPRDKDLAVDLNSENVAIIGQGNVAVDVARILLSPIDKLKVTDITDYSLELLSRSKVKNINFIGRRGPLQIACTIKEIREMFNLPGVTSIFDLNDFSGVKEMIPMLGRPRKRLTELLYKTAVEGKISNHEKTFKVIFKRTPLEFRGNNKVKLLRMAVNTLEGNELESQKPIITKNEDEIICDLVLCSIGYKSVQVDPDIPFDLKKGIAMNESGRVEKGLYCCGWLSTGPVGVIVSTMTNAFATAQLLHNDIEKKLLNIDKSKPGSSLILKAAEKKGIQIVRFEDWEKIEKEEEKRGRVKGKPREKIVSIKEMLEIAA